MSNQIAVQLTCSNKPRPMTQNGNRSYFLKTGAAAWGRDVHHATDDRLRTLCGRDCSEWLFFEAENREDALADHNLCVRCAERI
jgi:hypothetical protein